MASPSLSSGAQLPEKFYEGIEQFNRQEFFEAHETLESVWKDRDAQDRVFIQGIIQVAAGCHHLRNGNVCGALSLFKQALPKIEPFRPSYVGLDLESFVQTVLKMQSYLDEGNAWKDIVPFPSLVKVLSI